MSSEHLSDLLDADDTLYTMTAMYILIKPCTFCESEEESSANPMVVWEPPRKNDEEVNNIINPIAPFD